MFYKIHNNESGFILVLAMAMLVVLSIIGIAGTRTSVIDLKISGNEKTITQEFNIADSLWQLGALWVNYQDGLPDEVNVTALLAGSEDYIVRNYGDGGDAVLNEDLPDDTQDGTIQEKNFWYRVTCGESTGRVDGDDDSVHSYPVDIEVNVDGRTHVGVRIVKNWSD